MDVIIIPKARSREAIAVCWYSSPHCRCTWPDTPSIAAEIEPTVTDILSQCRNVRSLAAHERAIKMDHAAVWATHVLSGPTRCARVATAISAPKNSFALDLRKCSDDMMMCTLSLSSVGMAPAALFRRAVMQNTDALAQSTRHGFKTTKVLGLSST